MKQYQLIYREMIDQNKKLFDSFFDIHDRYALERIAHQEEFNRIGRQVLDVIRNYERRLVGKTESGKFSKFSTNLSEKFWKLVRQDFPKIDFVGAKLS